MRQTLVDIAQSAGELASHPFFSRLQPDGDLRRMLAFAPRGTFWVMTFQDIIRINAELTKDPAIRSLIDTHREEDTGHEMWFLADLEHVFGPMPTDVRWLFSPESRSVRTVSFAISAEVFQIKDDVMRLVFLEVIEAAAGVYFSRISRAVVASGHAHELMYFTGRHLAAEAGHQMHGDANSKIEDIVLTPDQRLEAQQLSSRMFARFYSLGDALLEGFDPPPRARDEETSSGETP